MNLVKEVKAVGFGFLDYFCQSKVPQQLVTRALKQKLLKHRGGIGKERRGGFLVFETPLRNLPKLNNRMVEAKIERHDARRAGSHLDFRIKMPDGTIQDFAVVKKTEFPKETGRPFLVVRTPHHSQQYFYTDKWTFGPGEYGEGNMNTVWRGWMDIHHSNKNKLEFSINEGDFAGRYCILKASKGWMLTRMHEPDPAPYWRERMDYKNTDKAREDAYASGDYIAERKVNGAHFYVVPGKKQNMVISRRISVTGKPIDRAANVPQLKTMKFPKEYYGRRIHVELVSSDGNPSTTAGLLNARPSLSRNNQCRLRMPVSAFAFDLEGDGTYLERKQELQRLAKSSPRIDFRDLGERSHQLLSVRLTAPKVFKVVEDNRDFRISPQSFSKLMKLIGEEGAVLKKKNGIYYQDPHIKDKAVTENIDLKIIGFQEGTGKHSGRLGALIGENPSTGKIVKCGTGFSDEQRDAIWNLKDDLKDQYVKIKANWITEGGGLHGPRFVSIHTDSGIDIQNEESLYQFAKALSEPGKETETKYRLISSQGWRRG